MMKKAVYNLIINYEHNHNSRRNRRGYRRSVLLKYQSVPRFGNDTCTTPLYRGVGDYTI